MDRRNYERNKENRKLLIRRWKKAHPEKIALGRATRRSALASIGREEVAPSAVFTRDKWRCKVCGCKTPKELAGTMNAAAPTLDHIIPLKLGWPAHKKESAMFVSLVQ
jgi:hypothetical protein